MKILYVQETDWLNKGPQQQHHLLERLSNQNHEIIVIDYEVEWKKSINLGFFNKKIKRNPPRAKACETSKVTLIRPFSLRIPVLNYLSISLSYFKEINKAIKIFKPDIVMGMGILTVGIAAFLAKRKKIPFVYLMVDKIHRLIPNKIFQFLGLAIEKLIHKNSDEIIAINELLLEYSIRMGAPRDKTVLIRAGVEVNLFKFNREARNLFRQKYRFKEDDIVLFFMGWLYMFSGLKETIEQIVSVNNQSVKLFILGEGDLKEVLLTLISKYDLENKVIIHEWINYRELPEYVSMADICILPAYENEIMNDIVPIKLYEYMALNKPVISTLLGGIYKEFGKNNGVVYINKSSEVIEKAIELKNKKMIDDLGEKAHQFVVKNCDWDKLIMKFYKSLVNLH